MDDVSLKEVSHIVWFSLVCILGSLCISQVFQSVCRLCISRSVSFEGQDTKNVFCNDKYLLRHRHLRKSREFFKHNTVQPPWVYLIVFGVLANEEFGDSCKLALDYSSDACIASFKYGHCSCVGDDWNNLIVEFERKCHCFASQKDHKLRRRVFVVFPILCTKLLHTTNFY